MVHTEFISKDKKKNKTKGRISRGEVTQSWNLEENIMQNVNSIQSTLLR